jgi:ribonuclease HI
MPTACLEPIIMEMERGESIMVVTHQAVLRFTEGQPLRRRARSTPSQEYPLHPLCTRIRFPIFQNSRCLGSGQAAFDAELEGIKGALTWHLQGSFKHMIIHSDSTSAIERASHTGVGPGQRVARDIHRQVSSLNSIHRSADIRWVKGHSEAPGNEAADTLAGNEGMKIRPSPVTSLTHLKTRIAKMYSEAKTTGSNAPGRTGTTSIGPPPPRRSHAWTKQGTAWQGRSHKFAVVTGDRPFTSNASADGRQTTAGFVTTRIAR